MVKIFYFYKEMDEKLIKELNRDFKQLSPEGIIDYFFKKYPNKVALASSLGLEDQILTKMLVSKNFGNHIFTLETGRLFPETYDLIERTNQKYSIKLKIYFPDNKLVEQMVNKKGINLFYESIENRKLCCHVRKIVPLKRAFKNLDVWICGLRKEQSITRKDIDLVEWDEANGLIKINPLIKWTIKDVWEYIEQHNIPFNPLHKKGFPSIGCQPCTRALLEGEDIRAGRWWWENPNQRECGLHNR